MAMSREAEVTQPREPISHRRFGILLVYGKRFVFWLLKPLLRLTFARQQQFNHLTVALAFHILELEKRIAQLEQPKNPGPHRDDRQNCTSAS